MSAPAASMPADRKGYGPDRSRRLSAGRPPRRGLIVFAGLAAGFLAVCGQLIHLALKGQLEISVASSEALTVSRNFSRPDILDRSGRLIAGDLEVHSLYADPAILIDADEVLERLRSVLPGLDETELGRALRDRNRRFVWVRRGLTPDLAQRVHDLGIPGLGFRTELRRAYPLGRLAGHLIGSVNVDNRGLAGIERHIDETGDIDSVLGGEDAHRPPVRLSLDIGVQHGLEQELREAMTRYGARGAAGLIMDASTGGVRAAASLPDIDPARPSELLLEDRQDKVQASTYELGSIFKMLTVAMALDSGQARLDSIYDVREPLTSGRFTIKDLHAQNRPLSVAEIFLHSSNVGAGMIALQAGTRAQQQFLTRFGLTSSLATEAGAVATPQVPAHWDRTETITISYGHGLAVAPVQFAAAAAALVNGGIAVKPTQLARTEATATPGPRLVSAGTSARLRQLMRLDVTHPSGTGKRADVPGYEVGGKTGTAEMPAKGGYRETAVISSFLAAFPMRQPRYVVLVMLFEPTGTEETRNRITAGLNAAPTAGRIIARTAPLLGVMPVGTEP